MKALYLARRLTTTALLAAAVLFTPFLATTGNADDRGRNCDLKGHILFSRSQADALGNLTEAGLFRARASGDHVVPLTPLKTGDLYVGGRWSPHGQDLVYEYTTSSANLVSPTQLYRANRDGGSVRQLTVGPGPKFGPAWSTSGWIAFINGQDENGCLWVVRPDGRAQHSLFCPNLAYESVDPPQWSLDGKNIYLDVIWIPPLGLEPPTFSNLYKVNVETGVATLILSWNWDDESVDFSVHVAPDGGRGIYALSLAASMRVVDYPAGNVLAQLSGSAPLWSKNSKHFAFSRNVSVPGSTGQSGALFVADADGSHERQLTTHLVANEFFTAADWSNDGTHIVINRNLNGISTVQIIDVNTGDITSVARGVADLGAWSEAH